MSASVANPTTESRGAGPSRRALLSIFLIGLVLRAGWGALSLSRSADPTALDFPDEKQYWRMAGDLAEGRTMTDEFGFHATRMPLYPWILSWFAGHPNGTVHAKVAQWFIGALAGVIVAMLGASVGGRWAGLIGGLIVACDPFLVFFSSLLLTETLNVTVLCALWWRTWLACHGSVSSAAEGRWTRVVSNALWLGGLAALCLYSRPASLGLIGLAMLYVLARRRFHRRELAMAGLAMLIAATSLLPWAWRNHRVIGHWTFLENRLGISLYDGVGPQATGGSRLQGIQDAPEVLALGEVGWNRHFIEESLKCIRQDPGRMIGLAWTKVLRMWNPFPNVAEYQSSLVRLVSAGWMIPLYGLTLAGVVLHRRRARLLIFLLLPVFYFTLLHAIFVASVRYRLPAVPMLAIPAALAVTAKRRRLFDDHGCTRSEI